MLLPFSMAAMVGMLLASSAAAAGGGHTKSDECPSDLFFATPSVALLQQETATSWNDSPLRMKGRRPPPARTFEASNAEAAVTENSAENVTIEEMASAHAEGAPTVDTRNKQTVETSTERLEKTLQRNVGVIVGEAKAYEKREIIDSSSEAMPIEGVTQSYAEAAPTMDANNKRNVEPATSTATESVADSSAEIEKALQRTEATPVEETNGGAEVKSSKSVEKNLVNEAAGRQVRPSHDEEMELSIGNEHNEDVDSVKKSSEFSQHSDQWARRRLEESVLPGESKATAKEVRALAAKHAKEWEELAERQAKRRSQKQSEAPQTNKSAT